MSSATLRSFCAAAGFACLASLLPAATTVAGQPHGVMTAPLAVGTHPLSFPLIREEVFTGIVGGNSGSTVTFAAGDVAAALAGSARYYLEVVTGPLEGERLDVASAASGVVTVNLAAGSNSTRASLAVDSLAGARAVIRQHATLKTIAAMFSPALVGNNSAAVADQVRIYQNGGLSTYYLRGDGVTWREPGKTIDQRDMVIAPDASILVQLISGAKRWAHTGNVRANGFRVNFTAGTRAFATGFPTDLSFADIGGDVDVGLPAGMRWVGNNSAAVADTIQIYSTSLSAFQTYYLRADGISWRLVGDPTDVAASKLLAGQSMLLLKRTNPDGDYFISRPFSL